MELKDVLLSNESYILPRYVTILKKQGITTAYDLLFTFPSHYDDYNPKPLNESVVGVQTVLEGSVASKLSINFLKSKLTTVVFTLNVEGKNLRCTIFNRSYLKNKLNFGTVIRVQGQFYQNLNNFTISNLIICDEINRNIVPSYHVKEVAQNKYLEIIDKVFRRYKNLLVETLPVELIEKHHLLTIQETIQKIHFADNMGEIEKAMNRIKYEELLEYELSMKYLHYQRISAHNCPAIEYDEKILKDFVSKLPYELTEDQKNAVNDILKDLKSPYQMNRLLQGEVGSGKTVVACLAILATLTSGYQAALMCPTEILAKQHFESITKMFKDYDFIKMDILTGSTPLIKREEVLLKLKSGEINLIIGTHALFQEEVEYQKLGLVVADEEHRFGVRQRVLIKNKGLMVNYLKMSATPIPRTLATSAYGDTDLSIIKTMPSNRKQVITKLVHQEDKRAVSDHIINEIKAGHQIYVVTPLIDESENIDATDAINAYNNFCRFYQAYAKVGLIHGKMTSEEKEEIMNKFLKNEIQILVATSIIEVGVNVTNATTILILGAERFGVATLHQLRGRVMRSDKTPYCFLIADSMTEASEERLKMVENTSDGFELAEYDLLHRGPGEFFGEKQSGAMNFKYANHLKDSNLLNVVIADADEIMTSKKLFDDNEYHHLYEVVNNNYLNKINNLD